MSVQPAVEVQLPRPRVHLASVLLSLLVALGTGMTVHVLAVLADGRHVVGDRAEYHYRAVLGLDRLINTPQEAIGWGAAIVTAGALLLWEHRRSLAAARR